MISEEAAFVNRLSENRDPDKNVMGPFLVEKEGKALC